MKLHVSDYKFEKDLDNVTAQYSFKENGEIKVLNSGLQYTKPKNGNLQPEALNSEKIKTTAALKVKLL